MSAAPYRRARYLLPALATAAAVVATGLTLTGSSAPPEAAAAAAVTDCPAGYSTFADFQRREHKLRAATTTGVDAQLQQAADDFARAKVADGESTGAGSCVLDQHPEDIRELALRAAQQAAPRLAPFRAVAPGAFTAAAEQRARMAPASIPGTEGTGKEYGKGPLIVDDPAYPSVNTLGLADNSGRVDSFDYDPVAGRLFAAVGSGGIWASDDLAESWRPVSESLPSTITGSVGWAAAKGSRPGTLLALTGEGTFGSSAFTGIGAYYTTDFAQAVAAGRQPVWQRATGLPDGALGFKLAVSPVDPDVVYAATGLGLFRSADGGRSYVNAKLPVGATKAGGAPCDGVTDIVERDDCTFANVVTDVVVQAPGGSTAVAGGKVIAAVGWRGGQRVEPGADYVQSPSNGIYGSTDGATFTKLTDNQVDSPFDFAEQVGIGRTELGATTGAGQDHDYLYAIVQDARLLNGGIDFIDAPVGGEETGPLNPRAGGTVLEGIYVSDDFGDSWVRVADSNNIAGDPTAGSSLVGVGSALGYEPGVQAWYNMFVRPDPTVQTAAGVPTRLVFGLEEVWENEQDPLGLNGVDGVLDGKFKVIGRYFAGESCQLLTLPAPECPTNRPPTQSYTTHPDQHDAFFLPIDPADGSKGVRLFIGNDGGVYRQDLTPDPADDTTNDEQGSIQYGIGTGDFDNGHWGRGANIGFQTLLPYAATMAKDGTVWAGLQDNGNMKIDPSRGFQQFETYGGDGFFTAVDPDNSKISYEEYALGDMSVTIDGGTSWRSIAPPITNPKFSNPFVMDATNAQHLMTAGKEVVETVSGPDTGQSGKAWKQVYDLGTASKPGDAAATPSAEDPANGMSAIDLVSDAAYVGFCGTCDILNNPAPFKNGLATNVGGDVDPERMTSRGWHIASARGLPNRYITSVRIDPRDVETVYVTLGGYTRRWTPPGSSADVNTNIGDGHLYVSHDAGESFTDITKNLPDAPATWVELRDSQVIVGTDLGAYASAPSGVTDAGFTPLADLPAVPIGTIEVAPHDPDLLTIATYGRGVWTYEFGASVQPVTYTRVQGADRILTAVETSKQQYKHGADTVVVAVAQQYADALAGAPLAYQLAAPMLLTPSSGLAAPAATEVRRLGAKRAFVLGGTSALSAKVEADLKAAGVTTVERIGGGDRFATAALVADKLSDKTNVFVVEGADADPKRGWPDAISVAPLSALQGRPILLVTTEAVPAATKKAMTDLGVTSATIVGGPAAVSEDVEEELAGAEGTVAVKRLAGGDRYATSVAVANVLLAEKVDASRVWLATGQQFPDALSAGPTVASDLGVMLLVDPTSLDRSAASRTWLRQQVGELRGVRFLGGTAAISDNVVAQVKAAVAAGPLPPPQPTASLAGPFGFEADEQGWTASGWSRAEPGHDSTTSFAVAPYGDMESASLTSPELTTPGGKVFVSWWERRDTEAGYDGYALEWSADGETWKSAGTFQGQSEGYPEWSKQTVTLDVPQGALQVRFVFTSDDICSSTHVPVLCAGDGYDGVWVDDVQLQR